LLAGIGLTIEAGRTYNSGNAERAATKALQEAINQNVDQALVTNLTDNLAIAIWQTS
jgi:hypothetical protein